MKIDTNCDNISANCDNIGTNCNNIGINCDNISTSHHIYRKIGSQTWLKKPCPSREIPAMMKGIENRGNPFVEKNGKFHLATH